MTTKPSDCTHLVAPHLVRTEKFLCGLAAAPIVLSDKWALDSAAAKQVLREFFFFFTRIFDGFNFGPKQRRMIIS
jgi:hypothetical protein